MIDDDFSTGFLALIAVGILVFILLIIAGWRWANSSRVKNQGDSLRFFGWVLLVGGILGTLFFFFGYNVSVDVPETGEQVNNFGLMNDRQDGLLISLAALIVGVLIILFAPKKSPHQGRDRNDFSERDSTAPNPAKMNSLMPSAEAEKRQSVSEKRLRTILESRKANK